MTVIEDHLRQKALETENQKMKSDRVRERSNSMLEQSTTTQVNPIVDMRDAYSKVLNSGYVPSEEEIQFRRFTSGSWVDKPKT
ncbi:MAG: hypothetical protein VXX97_01115 [Pseudomonadota bacterium]|nr:hypothetical protein [Pseudomonadota bacterium]